MRIVLDGEVIFEEDIDDAGLQERYRVHEAEQGRVAPSFALPVWLAVAAGFLAEYAAGKVLDSVLEWRQKRKRSRALAELDSALACFEEQNTGSADRVLESLNLLVSAGLTVTIELRTPAEKQLAEKLRAALPDGVSVVVEM